MKNPNHCLMHRRAYRVRWTDYSPYGFEEGLYREFPPDDVGRAQAVKFRDGLIAEGAERCVLRVMWQSDLPCMIAAVE